MEKKNEFEALALRARIAADLHDPGFYNIRNMQTILRECANAIDALRSARDLYAQTLEGVREALGQKETHFLCMTDDVSLIVKALEKCASGDPTGPAEAASALRSIREQP